MDEIQTLVRALGGRDVKAGYAALKRLLDESGRSDAVAPHLPDFAALLRGGNSYQRTRGALLLCANARWDDAGVVDGALGDLLALAVDPKPVAARQCIGALPGLAAAKPALAARIRAALEAANPEARYPDSMAPLVRRDIDAALAEIGNTPEENV